MSTATLNGPRTVKASADLTIDEEVSRAADHAAIVANVVASDVPTLPAMDKTALVKAYEESFDRSVKSIGSILDNTALAVYCQVGEDCYDTIVRSKALMDLDASERKVASSWSAKDHDGLCSQLAFRCRVLFPHLFLPSKDDSDEAEAKGKKRDPVRVSDYILAMLTVKTLRPTTGDCIDNLSFYLIVNYVARKVVSYSRTDLSCEIRKDWAEFSRIEIPRVASGKITVAQFLAQMDAHSVKLASAKDAEKHAGKTADQIAKMEADETLKKKTREAATRESKVRTALSTSLADGLAGVLTPAEIGAIISKSATDAKVSLPGALNPETGTASDILDLLKGMFMLKRFDEIRTVCTACAEMATMLDRFDSKPQAERKAG